uniref:Retrotransposon gag domain-containing protein n=1 Tax=Manihot esculenta TaxID=3983 RepID=A0A2C9U3L8_MANES
MIASLIKGKGTAEVGDSSVQTPEQQFRLNTSANKAISRPLLLEDAFSVAKVEMPDFDGTDPVGWVARSEQFFEIQNIVEETKVPLALVSMEGALLHWLRGLRQRNPLLTWEQLREELMQRYSEDLSENPYKHLVPLKQVGTEAEYVDDFVARASLVPNVTDKQCLGFFLNGLRENIRLRSHETTDLYKTMKLAKEIEQQRSSSCKGKSITWGANVMRQKGFSHGLGQGTMGPQFLKGSGGPQNKQKWDGLPSKPPDNTACLGNKTLSQPFGGTKAPNTPVKSRCSQQYSHQEYQEMRAKELCFKCRQSYSPLHECPGKTLRAIIATEEESFTEESEITEVDKQEEPKKMKFKGSIGAREVVILVDSGGTHNFVSTKLAKQMDFSITETHVFKVKLGDGCRVPSSGLQIIINFPWEV